MTDSFWWLKTLHLTRTAWPYVASVAVALSATVAAGHAVMSKKDERAALGWIGVIVLVPALGPLLYVLLGINRIHRKAAALAPARVMQTVPRLSELAAETERRDAVGELEPLWRLVSQVVDRPLLGGNEVVPLSNGDEAYPAMIEAIHGARRSVALCTYIFDRDDVGRSFLDALVRAQNRGVVVRILVDAVGSRYSWPSMVRTLRRAGLHVALFGQTLWPWRMPYANLRDHRKILLVDGEVGFTGGINLRQGHLISSKPPRPIADLHFRVQGPVLAQLWEAFAQDWEYSTNEKLAGD
ncbi:MAG TPA: phospholipase D-like domain-containing protein, partial [Myxococcota bacterium]|nr:phospholipase D-like domain-containing protein [Myxococcota bacterium]